MIVQVYVVVIHILMIVGYVEVMDLHVSYILIFG